MSTYRVGIDYKINTSGAESALTGLEQKFASLESMAAGFGIALGLREAISSIVELNSQFQTTRITLATMFQAGHMGGLTDSAEDFQKSLGMSSALIVKMRADARLLPGTFQDLMTVFKGSLLGGREAGKSINDIEHLAAGMMAVGVTLGSDSDQTARNIGMMFNNRLGTRNTLYTHMKTFMTDAKGKNIGQEAFKALDTAGKWDVLTRAVKGFQHGIDAAGESWDAISSTTKDYAQNLLRMGSQPVFAFMSHKLDELNKYYEQNKKHIDDIVFALGTQLADAVQTGFGVVRDAFMWIVDNKDTLISVAKAYAAIQFGGMLSHGKGALGGAASFASGIAGGALSGAVLSKLLDPSANALTVSIFAVSSALSTLPGPLGAFGTALTATLAGLQLFADWVDSHHKENLDKHAEGGRAMSLYKEYEIQQMNGRGMTENLARRTMSMLRDSGVIDKDVNHADHLTAGRLATYAALKTDLDVAGSSALIKAGLAASAFMKDRVPFGPKDDPLARALAMQGKGEKAPKTTVNVKIIQNIENANDPNRVLVKTREALESIFRNPITTPSNMFAAVK